MIARGYQFDIIQDIGSGLDYNKEGLSQLIDKITNGEIDKVVILYKDRRTGTSRRLNPACHSFQLPITRKASE